MPLRLSAKAIRLFCILLLVSMASTVDGQPARDCITFTSNGRLNHGVAYSADLPQGYQLHLRAEGDFGWAISVHPTGSAIKDYAWVVSPPLRTAPHRKIGPGYGLQTRDSARLVRNLRFVLSEADYQQAEETIDNSDAADVLEELDRLGKGTLTLVVESFAIRKLEGQPDIDNESFDWIEFRGEACVPRQLPDITDDSPSPSARTFIAVKWAGDSKGAAVTSSDRRYRDR